MFYAEKLQFFIATYVAALGQDKPISTRIEILQEGQSVVCLSNDVDAAQAALDWVTWKLAYGNKPAWLKPR